MSYATAYNRKANSEINKLYPEDRTVHEWYRFVLSFPPHLVRDYLKQFQLNSHHRVLDPFCGMGTVLVECKKLGIPGIGIEANPLAHFASQTKVDWNIDPQLLLEHASSIAEEALKNLQAEGIEDEPFFQIIEQMPYPLRTLPDERMQLLLTNSISPLPLHKTLVLLDCIEAFRSAVLLLHNLWKLTLSRCSSLRQMATEQ